MPLWNGNGLKSLKYGNVSTERLIDQMLTMGADLRQIEAKIFGGGVINISDAHSVGPRNIQVALDILKVYKIPVIASDVGGNKGRRVIFSNADGSAYVKYSK